MRIIPLGIKPVTVILCWCVGHEHRRERYGSLEHLGASVANSPGICKYKTCLQQQKDTDGADTRHSTAIRASQK